MTQKQQAFISSALYFFWQPRHVADEKLPCASISLSWGISATVNNYYNQNHSALLLVITNFIFYLLVVV